MVHFTTLILTAFCALSTATQGSITENQALANSAAEGSDLPQPTNDKEKNWNKEKNGDIHEKKGNDQKHDQKDNDHNDYHNDKHNDKDSKGHGDHSEKNENHDDKDNKGHSEHKESHGGRDNKDNKGHDDHKGSHRDHDYKKHMGHHGKPERFRWVDGDFGDFHRCPSPKAHCHNGNKRFPWDDHSKRCWIKYESGDECCYSFTQDGCHMFRKETIYTC